MMRGDSGRFAACPWQCGLISAAAVLLLAGFLTIGYAPPANALPSYARQTGQPCGTCHTDFPGLTPYGRRFKLEGYTMGGGRYRSTLFPDSPDSAKKEYVPPISTMAIVDYSHIQNPQAAGLVPSPPYAANNNTTLNTLSFFYGGAITDHIGAFAQGTYNPFGWHWDNTDIRFADSGAIASVPVVYGITANNNPTVQDPWNTAPAWAFPYQKSAFGAGLGPTPIIDGAFAQYVGSAGAYAYINDLVYLEVSVYRTLNPTALNDLGVDPTAAGQFNAAPYWRAAIEPHWGNHWLEFGTFGMAADVHPYSGIGTGSGATYFSQTVNYTDVGFDTQYQYQGGNFWLTLRGSYIYELQRYDPNFISTIAANSTDTLNEARGYASLAYGNKNRVVLTGQYFTSWGTPDATLYAASPTFSPGTKGWIAEIAYIPFIDSQAPGWPWFNVRIGLQYTAYTEFNGTSAGASDNNTLYLYLWMAM
jgi:hypothetical protein